MTAVGSLNNSVRTVLTCVPFIGNGVTLLTEKKTTCRHYMYVYGPKSHNIVTERLKILHTEIFLLNTEFVKYIKAYPSGHAV
jgi:hypothetical protein